jgi:hypothetical protein
MTPRERIKALLPVIQAWTEGKPTEWRRMVVGLVSRPWTIAASV